MSRRLLRHGVLVVGAGVALTGCETHRQLAVRSDDPDVAIAAAATRAEAQEPEADDLRASTVAKGFFKPTRLPGGWSDQANEIERSLGVDR